MTNLTEIEKLRAERDALAQAIHDARGILGFDNDGDDEPHTSDYFQYAEFHRNDAAEVRKDHDEAMAEMAAAASRGADMAERYGNALIQIADAIKDPKEIKITKVRATLVKLDSALA